MTKTTEVQQSTGIRFFCSENWDFEHLILLRISDFVLRILTQ